MIIPAVEAGSNEDYFATHRRRRFRRQHRDGSLWLIHRREANGKPVEFPRVLSPLHRPPPDDTDRSIGLAWFTAIYPDRPASEIADAVRRALQRGPAR
jgi:hypothetical protein